MNIRKLLFSSASLVTTIVSSSLIASPAEALILWGDALTQKVDCGSVSFLATCGKVEFYSQPFYPPISPYSNNNSGFEVPEVSSNIRAFNEKQNIILPRDIKIAKPNDNYVQNEFFANIDPDKSQLDDSNLAYDWDASRSNMPVLSQGILLNSHFIFFSRLGGRGRQFARAVIEFNTPIIGFIDTRHSDLTNDIFSTTQYNITPGRTLEGLGWEDVETRDYVKVLEDNPRILEIEFSTFDAFEGVRVLTQASSIQQVPEPLTILGTLTALGFGAMFKRKNTLNREAE